MKTYQVEITREQVHDICHAALVCMTHFTGKVHDCIIGIEPMALRDGYEANREYYLALFDKFNAIRCEEGFYTKRW